MRGLDRRSLGLLGAGHLCVDLCQGAVPALLPFLAAERGYSYAALGALVLFSTIGSSIVQPLFGLLSDRFARPWLMPAGLALAGTGIALAGPGADLRADRRSRWWSAASAWRPSIPRARSSPGWPRASARGAG